MKKTFSLLVLISFTILSCTQPGKKDQLALKTVDKAWLDSIIKTSDSSYSKPYKRTDFVTAFFYHSKKDSTICQVMKDSSGNIRQIIVAKNDIRSFFAQYFPNGQLQASFRFDAFGQYDGPATYYYQSGLTESTGSYEHGIKKGGWKYFDEDGKQLREESYDSNGQRIK